MKAIVVLVIFALINLFAGSACYYKFGKKVCLKHINKIERSISNMDYYQNKNGVVVGVSNKLIVKLKQGKNIDDILTKFNLSLEKNLGKDLYLLKTFDKNETVDMASKLYESGLVKYAQPDFSRKMISR